MANHDAMTPNDIEADHTTSHAALDSTETPYDRVAIFALSQPDSRLLGYYTLFSLILGPLFFLILIPLFMRYRTLRYRFDDEGIGMRWGALRRREVDLAYGRIQDIHLISNAVERWLGLARIKVQTASGSQKAEVVIEGIRDFAPLRTFLVERMRRARRGGDADDAQTMPSATTPRVVLDDASVEALRVSLEQATAELRAIRARLGERESDHA